MSVGLTKYLGLIDDDLNKILFRDFLMRGVIDWRTFDTFSALLNKKTREYFFSHEEAASSLLI